MGYLVFIKIMMNSDKNGYDFNFLKKNGQHLQNIQFCYYIGLVIMLRSLRQEFPSR